MLQSVTAPGGASAAAAAAGGGGFIVPGAGGGSFLVQGGGGSGAGLHMPSPPGAGGLQLVQGPGGQSFLVQSPGAAAGAAGGYMLSSGGLAAAGMSAGAPPVQYMMTYPGGAMVPTSAGGFGPELGYSYGSSVASPYGMQLQPSLYCKAACITCPFLSDPE